MYPDVYVLGAEAQRSRPINKAPDAELWPEEVSCCQSEFQADTSRTPHAPDGRPLLVAGSVGSGSQVPYKYAYQPHDPL